MRVDGDGWTHDFVVIVFVFVLVVMIISDRCVTCEHVRHTRSGIAHQGRIDVKQSRDLPHPMIYHNKFPSTIGCTSVLPMFQEVASTARQASLQQFGQDIECQHAWHESTVRVQDRECQHAWQRLSAVFTLSWTGRQLTTLQCLFSLPCAAVPPSLPACNLLTGQHESIEPEIWHTVSIRGPCRLAVAC